MYKTRDEEVRTTVSKGEAIRRIKQSLRKSLLLTQPKMILTVFELLTICGVLIQAIDACTYWFVESRWERDRDKRHIYNAIWETKEQKYKQVLEEVYAKLH